MTYSRHKRSRFWALRDTDGTLICVCVYKRGAQEVQKRLEQGNAPCPCRQSPHQPEATREEQGDTR